jgi:hypothetical protein
LLVNKKIAVFSRRGAECAEIIDTKPKEFLASFAPWRELKDFLSPAWFRAARKAKLFFLFLVKEKDIVFSAFTAPLREFKASNLLPELGTN